MAKSVSYAVSSRGMILVEGDTACDTDFAMFYTLYHIFQQESIYELLSDPQHLGYLQFFFCPVLKAVKELLNYSSEVIGFLQYAC